MSIIIKRILHFVLMFSVFPVVVHAVPTLQVGAYSGAGDIGAYADYQISTTSPTETDTAITSNTDLLFAGVYGSKTQWLGGQYMGGSDYGNVDSALSVFNGHGAIVMASVADGFLAEALATLSVGGSLAFFSSETLSGLYPNNHDPLKDGISDFLFFDIGNFAKNLDAVPDFSDETGAADGEIKTLAISGMGLLDWIHFDIIALKTDLLGQTNIRTTLENNPGSHDATWKSVPEPNILALFGIGLLGLGVAGRRRME